MLISISQPTIRNQRRMIIRPKAQLRPKKFNVPKKPKNSKTRTKTRINNNCKDCEKEKEQLLSFLSPRDVKFISFLTLDEIKSINSIRDQWISFDKQYSMRKDVKWHHDLAVESTQVEISEIVNRIKLIQPIPIQVDNLIENLCNYSQCPIEIGIRDLD